MIHFYTNREIANRLEINLARWKRWSRSFLPPDPLGGMQSGYARQYAFKDLCKVFLGGHLVSQLKLMIPESRQVLADLTPWLKEHGYFDSNGPNGACPPRSQKQGTVRIYVRRMRSEDAHTSSFGYLIRRVVASTVDTSADHRMTVETIREWILNTDDHDGGTFLQAPGVHLINLTPLFDRLREKLAGR